MQVTLKIYLKIVKPIRRPDKRFADAILSTFIPPLSAIIQRHSHALHILCITKLLKIERIMCNMRSITFISFSPHLSTQCAHQHLRVYILCHCGSVAGRLVKR